MYCQLIAVQAAELGRKQIFAGQVGMECKFCGMGHRMGNEIKSAGTDGVGVVSEVPVDTQS